MKTNISKKMTLSLFLGVVLSFVYTSASASLDAEWMQGTAAALEAPTNGVTMNKRAWGAIFNVPKGNGAWVHLPLPSPVYKNNVRSRLFQVLVQYNGTAVIDTVDVWDGPKKIASKVVNWTGNHLAFNNWGIVIIPNFPQVLYGVNIALHVKNSCTALVCANQSMNLVSAGGDFDN